MKLSKQTKVSAFILALMMLLSACGEAQSNDPGAEVSAVSEGNVSEIEQPETEPETTLLETLPANDFGGISFNTLIREEQQGEFYTESTGDLIDEEVFNRNIRIEDRFNCKLNWTVEPGAYAYVGPYQGLIRETVMAGDALFDIVTGQSNIVQPLNKEDVFVNLLEVDTIDLSRPYWVAAYTDGVNLTGKVCTVCGDYALTSFSNANVMFFNKSIMDEFSMEYPYKDALEGTWTIDKMIALSESVTMDMDGNGEIDLNDRKGLCGWGNTTAPFFSSCGLNYTEKGEDGKRVVIMPTERMIDAAEKLNAFCHTDSFINGVSCYDTSKSLEEQASQSFREGKFLFLGMVLEGIEYLREMEVDFGIMPYPKYDEDQDRYYTTILRRYTVAAVPTTAASPDNSAFILEALSADGSETIIPRYCERALKNKYVRDEDSALVLDLIKDSLYLEFVDMYYNDLGFSDFFAYYIVDDPNGTFASSYEKNYRMWQKKLEKLY